MFLFSAQQTNFQSIGAPQLLTVHENVIKWYLIGWPVISNWSCKRKSAERRARHVVLACGGGASQQCLLYKCTKLINVIWNTCVNEQQKDDSELDKTLVLIRFNVYNINATNVGTFQLISSNIIMFIRSIRCRRGWAEFKVKSKLCVRAFCRVCARAHAIANFLSYGQFH